MLLRRIICDDGKPSPEPDYEVIDDDGKAIGRMYETDSPSGSRWFETRAGRASSLTRLRRPGSIKAALA